MNRKYNYYIIIMGDVGRAQEGAGKSMWEYVGVGKSRTYRKAGWGRR